MPTVYVSMKKCPECKNRLSNVDYVALNFRSAIQGGNVLKAITWPGGYQFYVLAATFMAVAIVGEDNIELSTFGIFLPGITAFFVLVKAKYNLYKCTVCKRQFAGPRLAKYVHGDSTYI